MNEKILGRVAAKLEKLGRTAIDYGESAEDPEALIEGRFYQTLATRIRNTGASVGDIIPGTRTDRTYETYYGGGGYLMSFSDGNKRGRRVVEQLTLRGELVTEHESAEAAAVVLGVSAGGISQVATGRQAMIRGMVFRYVRK